MTKNFLKGLVIVQSEDWPFVNDAMSPGLSVTVSPSTSIRASPSRTCMVSSPGNT